MKADIHLESAIFLNTTFVGETVVYSGGSISITGCKFENCTFHLDGAAANTIHFLSALYRVKGQGPILVEELFQAIRDGTAATTRLFSGA